MVLPTETQFWLDINDNYLEVIGIDAIDSISAEVEGSQEGQM